MKHQSDTYLHSCYGYTQLTPLYIKIFQITALTHAAGGEHLGHILENTTNKIPCQLLDSEKTRLALQHVGILTSEYLLDDKIRSCL